MLNNSETLRNCKDGGCYYNCGGFALNTFDWFYPYENFDWQECYSDYEEKDVLEIEQELYDLTIPYIESQPNVRRLEPNEQPNDDEYLVLYRVSVIDDDFHFLRRSDDGVWFHKVGEGPVEEFEGDPYCIWNISLFYDGKIYPFAVKKGE